jgi:hypothetical protein
MNRNFIKISMGIIASIGSFYVFAEDTIRITVIATDKAAAVGYLVEGKRTGGLGKTYSGQGPVNKKYSFGYRKSAFSGSDISCGSLVLNKSSEVKLVVKGERCISVVN